MRFIKLTIGLACTYLSMASLLVAQIPAPQINLTGNIGCQGFPCLNNGILVLNSDTNHTMTAQETSAMFIKVTSSVALTATRNLVAPAGRFPFTIENLTTGNQSIVIIGQSGTGVTIPNGQTVSVWNDGTNYVQTSGSGSTGGCTTSNCVVTNPAATQIISQPTGTGLLVYSTNGTNYLQTTTTGAGVTGSTISTSPNSASISAASNSATGQPGVIIQSSDSASGTNSAGNISISAQAGLSGTGTGTGSFNITEQAQSGGGDGSGNLSLTASSTAGGAGAGNLSLQGSAPKLTQTLPLTIGTLATQGVVKAHATNDLVLSEDHGYYGFSGPSTGTLLGTLDFSTLSANRYFTLPDVSGTICLVSTCGGGGGGGSPAGANGDMQFNTSGAFAAASGGALNYSTANNIFTMPGTRTLVTGGALTADCGYFSVTGTAGSTTDCISGHFNITNTTSATYNVLSEMDVRGFGYDSGTSGTSATSWSDDRANEFYFNGYRRGIKQLAREEFGCFSIGDCGGRYTTIVTDGGCSAGSDECAVGHSVSIGEEPNAGYYGSTTTATTGATTLATTYIGGSGHFIDGTYVIDVSRPSSSYVVSGYAATAQGYSLATVSGSSVPVSTSWGVLNTNTTSTANGQFQVYVTQTLPFTLGFSDHANSTPFVTGSACLSGNFMEQVPITAGSVTAGVQTITFLTRYGWNAGNTYLTQGGTCGQFAYNSTNSMKNLLMLSGGIDSTHILISGCATNHLCNENNLQGYIAPAGSTLVSYPGAEVISGTGNSPASIALAYNTVPWTSGDFFQDPHPPVVGIKAFHFSASQQTPTTGLANSAIGNFAWGQSGGPGTYAGMLNLDSYGSQSQSWFNINSHGGNGHVFDFIDSHAAPADAWIHDESHEHDYVNLFVGGGPTVPSYTWQFDGASWFGAVGSNYANILGNNLPPILTGVAGQVPISQGYNFANRTISGDATLAYTGALTINNISTGAVINGTYSGNPTFSGTMAAAALNVAGSPVCTTATGCGGSAGTDYYWSFNSCAITSGSAPAECQSTTTLPGSMPDASYQLMCSARISNSGSSIGASITINDNTLTTSSGGTIHYTFYVDHASGSIASAIAVMSCHAHHN